MSTQPPEQPGKNPEIDPLFKAPTKNQSVSHMLLFFVIPCAVFLIWASVKLVKSALEPRPPQDVATQLERIKSARSAGDRWQAAYELSQQLQVLIRTGKLATFDPVRKEALYTGLADLLQTHSTDVRLKRYLYLTLGQMGEPRSLPILEKGLSDADTEVRFFSAYGNIQVLSKNPSEATPTRLETISTWLKDSDPALRKIAATYLVQTNDRRFLPLIEEELRNPDKELRWNAAVALASVGNPKASPVLAEMFDLKTLRSVGFKSAKDLRQLLAGAFEAAKKLNDSKVLALAAALKAQASPQTPEGRAILGALGDPTAPN